MGHSTDIDLLRKRMATSWKASGIAGVSLLYDNAKPNETLPTKFIRFSVRPSQELKTNLGSERNRIACHGRVWVQVVVPIGTLDGDAWLIADKVSSIFGRWRSVDGTLHCKEITTDVVPDTTNYIIAVKVFYQSSRVE
jgi:hypothetical protein